MSPFVASASNTLRMTARAPRLSLRGVRWQHPDGHNVRLISHSHRTAHLTVILALPLQLQEQSRVPREVHLGPELRLRAPLRRLVLAIVSVYRPFSPCPIPSTIIPSSLCHPSLSHLSLSLPLLPTPLSPSYPNLLVLPLFCSTFFHLYPRYTVLAIELSSHPFASPDGSPQPPLRETIVQYCEGSLRRRTW